MNYLHKIDYKNSIFLIYLVIFTQLLHLVSMHVPFMQKVLSVQPVSLYTWMKLALLAIGLVAVMGVDKWPMKRRIRKHSAQALLL
ncbi:MAG TPA: hypothetical protein EYG78_03625 [Sulfurovum sp.]|nr:hypothetical protein [Sulfurovum sp.]